MTCFNKITMTSISNTTSKLCLITPGVCVGVGCVGATYLAFKPFFHSCELSILKKIPEIFPERVANLVNKLVHAHSFVYLICNSLGKYFRYFNQRWIKLYLLAHEKKTNTV